MYKDNKVTIHCVECDSTELTMLNATTIWDVDKQKWEYFENDDPIYQCANCGMDNDDYNKKEMKILTEVLKYYKFLVKLRNSGVTNMLFPAVPIALQEAYDLDYGYANEIVDSWIESFKLPEDEQPDDGRNDEYHGEYDDYNALVI